MHELRVGQPYHPGRKRWPEGAEYNYRAGGHELAIRLSRPMPAEIEGVRRGQSEFALYASGDQLLLLYRFGAPGAGLPWSDAPYSWHEAPAEQRQLLPETEGAARALLTVVLLDADTGLIRALRAVTFSPAFTTALHAAIRAQAGQPWSEALYDANRALLYGRYPTTEALLAACAIRCQGGIA